MTPEVPSALSPLIRRVVADNPGLMTGPGTNTYLVGIDEVAVIDPGPDDREARRLDRRRGDEGPGALGAAHAHAPRPLAGRGEDPQEDRRAGRRLRQVPEGRRGEARSRPRARRRATRSTGTEFRLEALHTPGHAPNHLCFLLDEERALFTGDHVLNGTTTVVNPQRGGDMAQYLASLERLRKIKRVGRICPGHGDVIEDPVRMLDEYVAHRKQRERQILRLLGKGPAKISDDRRARSTSTRPRAPRHGGASRCTRTSSSSRPKARSPARA